MPCVSLLPSKRNMTSYPSRNLSSIVAVTFVFVLMDRSHAESPVYSDILRLTKNTIENSDLNKDLRPLFNQSHVMTVNVTFSVVSVVSVDDVTQSCVINGFVMLTWTDEFLRWNTSDYGGFSELQTQPAKLWHPRLLLVNAVGERENFEKKSNPMIIRHTGIVTWVSGALLSVACDLDIRKFPFDEQTCEIFFCPMGYFNDKLVFVASETEADKTFFYANKAWDMTSAVVSVSDTDVGAGVFSCPRITFHLKRRPSPFAFNVLAPLSMLSFLNLFVFTIPAESGEKISFGITVLLSVSVYMSEVYSMLPNNADEAPAVMLYLFFLMTISVLSVLASIVTVFLHHSKEDQHEDKQDANYRCNNNTPRVTLSGVSTNGRVSQIESKLARLMISNRCNDVTTVGRRNRYDWISKNINRISLAFFLLSWIGVSLWFFVYVLI